MVSTLPTGKPYSRLEDFPLDASSVFPTLIEAEDYAQNNPIAYQTQIIGVIETDMVYRIAGDKSLVPIQQSGGGTVNPDDLVTSNVTIDETITLLGTALGALPDGSTIPDGTTLTQFVKMITQKRIAAVYSAPTLSLAATGTKTVEAGTNVATTLTSTFTQNDAGAISQYKVQKNGTDVFTDTAVAPYTPATTVIGDETWTFRSTATYAAGPIKNDNMGDASPAGAIGAGSINSSNVVFTGKRNTFYGADTGTSAAASSAEVRALAETALGQSNGSTFTVNIPVGATRISIAYPDTLQDISSAKYVEQGNAEYKDKFIPTSVTVEGYGGFTGINYKVLTYLLAVPTPAAMTFQVTI